MPLHVSSTFAHHQEVKIAIHSLWYHHTYRCDDTRGCVMQFWLPDDEHMCLKHVQAWNKLIVKQKCCASSWLITEINILRCTVSKTSKKKIGIYAWRMWRCEMSVWAVHSLCVSDGNGSLHVGNHFLPQRSCMLANFGAEDIYQAVK